MFAGFQKLQGKAVDSAVFDVLKKRLFLGLTPEVCALGDLATLAARDFDEIGAADDEPRNFLVKFGPVTGAAEAVLFLEGAQDSIGVIGRQNPLSGDFLVFVDL